MGRALRCARHETSLCIGNPPGFTAGSAKAGRPLGESMFRKQNSGSAFFMLSATVWLLIGVLMGLLLALELVFPDIGRGISWLVFGRLRQADTSTVMFAFLSGDAPPTVEAIARKLKVDHAQARLTPEAKADCIAGWQRSGLRVGMVGDGVIDAPALAAPLRPLEMCAKRQQYIARSR